jgi:hypothetical protein
MRAESYNRNSVARGIPSLTTQSHKIYDGIPSYSDYVASPEWVYKLVQYFRKGERRS